MDRPILFNGDMVRAIIDGRKTQTRRPIDSLLFVETTNPDRVIEQSSPDFAAAAMQWVRCPYGAPGDRLWVRERARVSLHGRPGHVRLTYEADGASAVVPWPPRLRPPRVGQCVPNGVHREGARVFLDVTSIRAERVQDISEEDALAEGVNEWLAFELGLLTRSSDSRPRPVKWFNALWDRVYPGSWERNDWVWCVAFRKSGVR
jgi:hypothetical protein